MWDQYRKTFWAMQAVIVVVAMAILAWSRLWTLATLFFVTMQASSVVGGLWAHRLAQKTRSCRLPASERT
jgi:hypothetical protein